MNIDNNKIDILIKQNEKILKKLEEIEKENKQMKLELKEIREENSNLRKEVDTLKGQKEYMKQDSLKNNIVISGLPLDDNSSENDLNAFVVKIIKNMDITLTEQDMKCFKVGKGDKKLAKVIFSKPEIKEQIMVKKKTIDLNTNKIGLSTDNTIYINHDMTPKNQLLLKKARELKQKNQVKFSWYKDGTVYVRKTTTSPTIRIKSEEDLTNLKKTKMS